MSVNCLWVVWWLSSFLLTICKKITLRFLVGLCRISILRDGFFIWQTLTISVHNCLALSPSLLVLVTLIKPEILWMEVAVSFLLTLAEPSKQIGDFHCSGTNLCLSFVLLVFLGAANALIVVEMKCLLTPFFCQRFPSGFQQRGIRVLAEE